MYGLGGVIGGLAGVAKDYVSGNLGWKIGFLPYDIEVGFLNTPKGAKWGKLVKGTLVRVYTGTIPAGSGIVSGDTLTPGANENWLIEKAPPAGGFWHFYTESPATLAVVQSKAYKDETKARYGRMGAAAMDPMDLVPMDEVAGAPSDGTATLWGTADNPAPGLQLSEQVATAPSEKTPKVPNKPTPGTGPGASDAAIGGGVALMGLLGLYLVFKK